MTDQNEQVDTEIIELDSQTLAIATNAEIDKQIATAKQYPRSITKFKQEVREMALMDEDVAGGAFYVLPGRKKKNKKTGKNEPIEGPTIRFAEIAATAWGNIRHGGQVVDIGKNFITAEGIAFDVQKNVATRIQVKRRITTREGRRYSDDMIQVTGNAAVSLALRNAIFKVVPLALIKDIYEEAKLLSIGKGLSIEQQREKMIKAFSNHHKLKEADILQIMGRNGREDLSVNDIITLRGIYTAINDGDTTVEQLLKPDTKPTATINERLQSTQDAPEKPKTDATPVTPTQTPKETEKAEIEPNKGTEEAVSENVDTQTGEITKSDGQKELSPEEKRLKELRGRITSYQIDYGKARKMAAYNRITEKHGAGQGPHKLIDVKAAETLVAELEKGLEP